MKRIQPAFLLVCCFIFSLGGCAVEPKLSEPQMEAQAFSSWEDLEQAVADRSVSGLDCYYVPTAYKHLPVDVILVNTGYVTVRYVIGDPTGAAYEGVEAEEAELLTTTVTFVWHLGDGEKKLKDYARSLGLDEIAQGVYAGDITRQSWPDTVLAREYYWLGKDGELFQLTLPFHETEVFSGSSEWMSVEREDIS